MIPTGLVTTHVSDRDQALNDQISSFPSAMPYVSKFRGRSVTCFAFSCFPNRMIKEEIYVSIERALFSLGHFRQLCLKVTRYSY